jgi:uncharacterized RDD family membrane protein YckC
MQPTPSPRGRSGPTVITSVPATALRRQGQTAGVVSRLLADALDLLVLIVFLGMTYVAVCAVRLIIHPSSFTFPAVSRIALLATAAGFSLLYLTLCWLIGGRTYGDRVLALRVVNIHGRRLSILAAASRAALCIGFPIGLFWCLFSRTHRSLQDIVARTSVVYDWRD